MSMKVFWYQGGLFFEPEGSEDRGRLEFLAKQYKVQEPKPSTQRIAQGSTETGGGLYEYLIGGSPRGE